MLDVYNGKSNIKRRVNPDICIIEYFSFFVEKDRILPHLKLEASTMYSKYMQHVHVIDVCYKLS